MQNSPDINPVNELERHFVADSWSKHTNQNAKWLLNHEMALEFVCRVDFWCNRHCRTSPVVLEGFWGQVWPKISQKTQTN